ncbi:Oidioi.mRNA.OKI2018_I69.chr1.g3625.t1.cds [Oikopleura dioica]|uniref:Oidioi.mRNA.OKI2018_I69.chr1.g3625.t1.cds n=1 Tax=Oikopleura dioica TaxID=34765 RepID=A0ABN7SUT0_OIKDI|nr:Oidioi.mRNA.OKI2018_I69.chr1.g3625.t1.cds [Oikopleura dioica]
MRLLSRLLLQGLILEQVFATSEPPCKVSSIPEGLNPSGGRFEWKCTKIKNGKRKCKPKCVGDAGKKQTYTIACVNKNNSNTWTVFRGSAPSCTATVVKCLADAIPSRFKPAGAHTFVCKRHNVGSSCKVKCLNGGDSGDFVVRCKNKKNIWTIRKGITVPTCSETTTVQPTTEPSQPTCIPDEFKWCIAWGDPHFTTFDGEFHHLQPQCEYVMAKVDAAEYSNMPAFKIIGDFAPLEPGSSLTYTQGFTFEFPGQDQSPDEVPRYVISVEREDLRDQSGTSGIRRSTLEDRLTGNSYDSSFLVDDFDLTITPTTVEIETWFDVYIKYTAWGAADVRNLKLEIKVPDCYAHNIDGLCGNFDGQQYVEFTPGTSGSLTNDIDNWQTTQENLYEWAEQFELPDEQCHHIFGLNCAVDINHAITACIALDPDNTDSVFAPCNGDKSNAFLSCVTEKCDQSDECPAFASFAKECINDLGPEERGPVCDWATGLGCSTACGANAVFEGCADTCAARRTCRNRHQTDIERCDANTEIDSMCVCQPGFILDGDDCIPEENCGCTENGYYYSLGSTFQKPVYNPEENCECTTSGIVCTPIPCDQMERGSCKVHSDPWITTFDNTKYAFHGSCRYNLVRAEDTEDRAGFSIEISNRGSSRWEDTSGRSGTVVDQIWLEAHSSNYVFGDQKRYYFHFNNRDNSAYYSNTELDITLFDRLTGQTYFNADFSNDDVSLKITFQNSVATGFDLHFHWNGLQVKFKAWYWWMDVYVPGCYKESVSGLCGDWDGNGDVSLAQDYENNPDEFGERFLTSRISDECSHGRFFEPCEDLTPAEFTSAIRRCDSLEDGTAQAEVFKTCNFVSDKQGYYDICLWNSCLDLACGSIQSFAHDCLLRKTEGTADFYEICNWPQVTSCSQECSGGQIFKGCTNACKEERTCDDVVNGISDADRCGSERSIDPMCGCPDGQVMHNGECINEDACPRDCISTGTSYCEAAGDPHYDMFDGDTHHFQGACKYSFVKSAGDDEFSNMPAFSVDVDQRRCGEDYRAVSCIRGMTFEFPGKNQLRSETPRYFLTIDGFSFVFEDRLNGQSYENGFTNDDVRFEKIGNSARVTTWFGAKANYLPHDGGSVWGTYATVRVTLPDCYMNHVDGLCGNWNGVPFDQFHESHEIWRSESWRAHQKDLVEWANDFAEPDPRCREVHDFECDDIGEVTDLCAELDKNIPGGVFHECTAPKDAAHMSCMIDTCISRDARCNTLQNYARQCLSTIPSNLQAHICSWAAETDCELECGENSSYLGCANTCDAQRTCRNRHLSSEERCGSSINNIESMCVCDPGYILDDEGCVLEENCGCTWDFNNQYYARGQSFSNNDESCECTADGIVCAPIPCGSRPTAYCKSHNDPYIYTFDHYEYFFHGNCRYNLASAPDTPELPGFNVNSKNRKLYSSTTATVTDQLWFDFHGIDYVFGDPKPYTLFIKNMDTSGYSQNAHFEITLTDHRTGQNILDAVPSGNLIAWFGLESSPSSFKTSDYEITVTRTHWYSSYYYHTVEIRIANGISVKFSGKYWSAYVNVNSCYKNIMTGLCGNYNDNNSDERLLSTEYDDDSQTVGDRFQTDSDDTCTHGELLKPCEDLLEESGQVAYDAAEDRCEIVSPYSNQNFFNGCEFLGSRLPTYEACLFHSCLDPELHCGIIEDYASQCLTKKIAGSADYQRICDWASVTGCAQECPQIESGLGESPIRAEDPFKISLDVYCSGEPSDAMTGMASFSRKDGSFDNHYYFGVGGVTDYPNLFFWMENPDFEEGTGWELISDEGSQWWIAGRNPTYVFPCTAGTWNSVILTQEYQESDNKWVKTLTIERLSKKEITAQVFKGCTNACFEQQTCEDVARGISKETRCAATANRVEGMCGCPDGFLFEDGVCVLESSCGCINNDGSYVELGTVEGRCTCTSTGYECAPESCPCEEFDSCIDFICEDAQSFFVPEDGVIGEFTATRNFELSYEFNCGAIEASSTYIGPHIYATGEFPRSFNEADDPTKPTEKGKKKREARSAGSVQFWYVSWTNANGEDSPITSVGFNGGTTSSGYAFFYNLGYCDGETFNTMKYTQNFDEEAGTYTQNFYFNGELKETKVYPENEFTPYEGDLTVSLLARGSDSWQRWPGTIKNFYIRETFPNRIVLVNNEPIAPAEDTMIATVTSSAYYTAEMEIFCASDSLPLDGGLFGYKSILHVTSGTDYGELGSRVFTVWRSSGSNLLYFANPIGKTRGAIAVTACDAGQYNHWKLVVRADDADVSISVAELFKDDVLIATRAGPKSDTIGDGEELQVWAGNGWPDFPGSGYGIGSTYLIKNVIFTRQ